MKYYTLEPEVPAEWGDRTEADTSEHPPRVSRLHLVFNGWLGDSLVESFPCYVATSRLVDLLSSAQCSGIGALDVEVTVSEQFKDLYGDKQLPTFSWIKVTGVPGTDDFGVSRDLDLVVSERALGIMKQEQLDHCDIEEWSGEHEP